MISLNYLFRYINNSFNDENIEFDKRACATVVAVSEGYPGEYEKN